MQAILALALALGAAAAPAPAPAWKLRAGMQVLDGPGSGRYTQIRVGPDGLATLVWNGEPGLRLARCTDRRCSTITPPQTVLNSSGHPVTNPRFIRMELAPNGNPVLAYATADDTQATIMHCHDLHCLAAETSVLATAHKVRHCDLALHPVVTGQAIVTFGLSDPPLPTSQDCKTCAGFRDASCRVANYTAFSECNCGGGGCDCSSCCAGQAKSDCCSVAPSTSGCQPVATHNGSTLLVFHMTTPANWKRATVATATAAFGVNTTSGLPTGGLEMPSVANREPQHWAPDLAYWDVAQRRLVLVQDVLGIVGAPRHLTVAQASREQQQSSPGCWPRLAPVLGGGLLVTFFDLERGALLSITCSVGSAASREDSGLFCADPQETDSSVGHRDVSDFGAGAFPSFAGGLSSPARKAGGSQAQVAFNSLVYFSQQGAPKAECEGFAPAPGCTGYLKVAEFAASGDSTAVHTLATGQAGFGRDASIAFQVSTPSATMITQHACADHICVGWLESESCLCWVVQQDQGGGGTAGTMLVSFLDLQGHDGLQTMRARLAIFDLSG